MGHHPAVLHSPQTTSLWRHDLIDLLACSILFPRPLCFLWIQPPIKDNDSWESRWRIRCTEVNLCSKWLLNTGLQSDHVWAFFHLACSCVHGRCSRGPSGDGSCECDVGWRGVKCDSGKTEPLGTYSLFLASLFSGYIFSPFWNRNGRLLSFFLEQLK